MGGHWAPNSTVGDKALWKNPQNIAKKNKASDNINKPTPRFSPFWTASVWFPRYVPSLITSRHQKDIERTRDIKANIGKIFAYSNPCIVDTPLVVNVNSDIHVNNGQGLGFTRWKGWAWYWLLVILFILIKKKLKDVYM